MYHLQSNVDTAAENSFSYIFKCMSLKEREKVGSDSRVQTYQSLSSRYYMKNENIVEEVAYDEENQNE